MLAGQPLALDLAQPNDILVGDFISANSPLTLPDDRPEDALAVNCGNATASAGSQLCLRSAGGAAGAAAAPAPAAAARQAGLALAAALASLLAGCGVALF